MNLKRNLTLFLLITGIPTSIHSTHYIQIINSTPFDIAVRPVMDSPCYPEPHEVIRSGQTRTPWSFSCHENWHFDISDEWDANKSWMPKARNKNRPWGYSYHNVPLTWKDNETIIIEFVWDHALNAPHPYIRNGKYSGKKIELR